MFGDSEKLRHDRLRKSLIAKSQHPIYSKIKAKILYAILIPFTFYELARLATYRVAPRINLNFLVNAFSGTEVLSFTGYALVSII